MNAKLKLIIKKTISKKFIGHKVESKSRLCPYKASRLHSGESPTAHVLQWGRKRTRATVVGDEEPLGSIEQECS